MTEPTRILYMEDDPGAARLFKKKLEREGYAVDIAADGEEGLTLYEAGEYDILATDLGLPVLDGLEVIRRLALKGPLPPLVVVTGTGDERIAVKAMKLGAGDYIVKDVGGAYLELLPSVIEQLLFKQTLIREKERAEAERELLIKELDAFAHTVAHDLKNPISALMLHVDLLQRRHDQMTPEKRKRSLYLIERTTQKMRSIIQSLLLLAKVRSLDEVAIEPLDMGHIVSEALDRLDYLIGENGAEIALPARETWPRALGYGPWVEEIWANYLSNAIKYGGADSQTPRVALGAESQADAMVRFWVKDNGPGLTPEEQEKVFTEFTRLRQVQVEGHGLGLSIVQRIAKKLGGHIGVESQPGEGSIFYFTLPRAD